MAQTQEDMLRKVRALLAKADGTDNPHEADTFRAAAERLMVKWNIEQWQLAQEQKDDKVIGDKQMDFRWYSHSGGKSEAPGYLWSLFQTIARHCRVKVIYWKPNWYDGTIPVVGTQADISYFDMLFTTCMLEMGKGLEPHPDSRKSFEENIAIMKEAGMQWLRMAELLHRAGMLDQSKYGSPDDPPPTQQQVHNMGLATVYTKFCDRTGRPRHRTTPKIYQRSFMLGFEREIARRLRAMRQARTQEMPTSESSGMELVLADIWQRVEHQALELYGNPPKSRGGGGRYREVRYDEAAAGAGAAAASKVDLGVGKVGKGPSKQIGK